MLKQYFLAIAIAIASLNLFSQAFIENDDLLKVNLNDSLPLVEKLKMLPGVEVEEIPVKSKLFSAEYKLMIKQPVDHEHPEKGYFKQKVYLYHSNEQAPMVMYLDGYKADRGYVQELAYYLNGNTIHIEHRFFGESAPDSIPWEYLNIKQAAADHHRIVVLLKNIYQGKWISCGISKGGQTAIFHRRFYPDDVLVTVPYVAPLNLDKEDPRIYEFLENVDGEDCRKKLEYLQTYLLKNRKKTYPVFKEKVEKIGYEFTHSMDSIFELSVFELGFAFWQWGGNCATLPAKPKPEDAVNLLFSYDVVSFFEKSSINETFPFFYQAYTEMGLYGYKTEKFKKYLVAYKSDVDNYETFIPKRFHLSYDKSAMQDIYNWLKDNGNNFLYIYGEVDAWSATAFEPSENTNAVKIVNPGGSHMTRIRNLPQDLQDKALKTLEKWLNIKIENNY
ncbi:MAG: S28 family serine protease [Marinilabiliales bacterium]